MTALPEAAYNIPMPGPRGKYGNQNNGKWQQANPVNPVPMLRGFTIPTGRPIKVRYHTLGARAASVFM